MMTTAHLTVHLHDDTAVPLPAGTRYHLDRAVAPDGTEHTWPAWDVLRVDATTDRAPQTREATRP
jgi:hypothetical protein